MPTGSGSSSGSGSGGPGTGSGSCTFKWTQSMSGSGTHWYWQPITPPYCAPGYTATPPSDKGYEGEVRDGTCVWSSGSSSSSG